MSVQQNFPLPEQQGASINIPLQPPTNISGWSAEFDLLYRTNSLNPLWSAYLNLASGNTGVSGITATDINNGVFSVALNAAAISGVSQETAVLAWRFYRTDVSGSFTPIAQGLRLLTSL